MWLLQLVVYACVMLLQETAASNRLCVQSIYLSSVIDSNVKVLCIACCAWNIKGCVIIVNLLNTSTLQILSDIG